MVIHIRQCLHCKQNFVLKNIAYEKRGGGKYCSKQCSKYATKKYHFNENFFNTIDSSDKAYWLGFLMADGCNTGDELSIELSATDDIQLTKLKEALDANQKISYRWRGDSETVSLRLASRYFCQKLAKLGCTQRKSFTLQFPNEVPPHFIRDFIRGFFDGDGCIAIRADGKNKVWSIYSCSEPFIIRIKEEIEKETGIPIHHYIQNENGHVISVMRTDDIKIINQYLYDGATTFMERKEAKFSSPVLPS
jgi:hypothetical protein